MIVNRRGFVAALATVATSGRVAATLPRGVKRTDFVRFIEACRAAIGGEHVIADAEGLASYARSFLPFDESEHAPAAALSVASLDEVKAILAIALASKVPLWPISTGRNMGYGSATVADPGTVILDMRRMNRITDMDPVLGTVVVEPGVTYQQLQDFLRENGHNFWLDFPGPGPIVSPIGNTLERGEGQTPYSDHFAHSCGYEVLLADGTVLRTGLGGVAGTTSWQSYKYGFGPTLDGIFTQSNFGIVTKMGLHLMPAPETYRTGMAVWPDPGDIEKLIDTIRPLRLDGTIGNSGTLGNATIIASGVGRENLYTGPGSIPPEIPLKWAKEQGLGAWVYLFSIYGRKDRVASDWAHAVRTFEASGAKVVADVDDPAASNQLTLKSFSLFKWKGGKGLIWFSPVAPARGKDVGRQMVLAQAVMARFGMDFMTGLTMSGRATLNVMPIVYDRDNPDETQRARDCMMALIDEFAAEGFGLYRTGIGFMDRVAAHQGSANLEVNRRIKRALDPTGILAPGKSGIRI
jgi:4-cresol dehydrogenase (hydroxylating) flavoprotein subunit